jgi:Zn-dependent protease
MDLTPEQIRWILVYLFVLVISVALHEFGHAIMADKLGDDTPRRQGRVTLNPLAHAHPIGTLLLPLAGAVITASSGHGGGGFGFGRPVEWQPNRIRRGITMATANILVSLAGPAMNVVLAIAIAGVHAILLWQGVLTWASEASLILAFAVQTNFVLFFFNLVPIPPLDGGHVAESLMPYRHRDTFDNFAKYGPFIVLGLVVIPGVSIIFVWPATQVSLHLYHLFGERLYGVL